METDWSVEVGGDAAAIEALWDGFVDLRGGGNVKQIGEAGQCAELAEALLILNDAGSPWWTSKCDLWWENEVFRALYIDLLPRFSQVFATWNEAEAQARRCAQLLSDGGADEASAEFVVRLAVAGPIQGFGLTFYLTAPAESFGKTLSYAAVTLARAIDFPEAGFPVES